MSGPLEQLMREKSHKIFLRLDIMMAMSDPITVKRSKVRILAPRLGAQRRPLWHGVCIESSVACRILYSPCSFSKIPTWRKMLSFSMLACPRLGQRFINKVARRSRLYCHIQSCEFTRSAFVESSFRSVCLRQAQDVISLHFNGVMVNILFDPFYFHLPRVCGYRNNTSPKYLLAPVISINQLLLVSWIT